MEKEKNYKSTKETEKTYNEVPYISKTFPNTHPRRMAAITHLYGFHAPDVKTARVLEIGCSFGGNIIPLAIVNPEAEFIGLDLAEYQVEEGKKLIEKLELKNIQLHTKDIMDYQQEYGLFDYIICHGVFSWVPKEVQEKILEVVKTSLKPEGLACISYNTNPGWKDLSIARDIMLWNKRNLERQGQHIEGSNIVEYGKKSIQILQEYSGLEQGTKTKLKSILEKSSHYLYHEYYEIYNEAFYLYEFQDMLLEKGLSHVCDTELEKSLPIHWADFEKVEAILSQEAAGDKISKEQYYDFLFNRQFRISIVAHQETEQKMKVSRDIQIENLQAFYLRSNHFKDTEKGVYITNQEQTISPEYQTVLEVLEEKYPESILVKDLVQDPRIGENNDSYGKILHLMYRGKVYFSLEKTGNKKQEHLKIDEKWKKYIKYFAEEENPIISFSNSYGELLLLDLLRRKMLLEFDGKSNDELYEYLLREKEKGNISIQPAEGRTEREEVEIFLDSLRRVIERSSFEEK